MGEVSTEELSAWVEVDRAALAHNLREVRRLVGPAVRVLAVVKADAYGHGAVEASRVFATAGADFLGVTRLEEGIELRHAGVTTPTLVFSAALPSQARAVVAHDLSQTVCSLEAAQALGDAARAAGRPARIHVKVDTGMGRLGIRPEELLPFCQALTQQPGLQIEGIYTHFATAFERKLGYLRRQLRAFLEAVAAVEKAGLRRPVLHAANSAALIRFEAARLDMVRPGTVLYGQYPSDHVPRVLSLRQTWELRARVVSVKQIERGESVGYGRDFVAQRSMTVATLPLGYCEGLTLSPTRTARSMREALVVLRDFARRGRAGVRIHGAHAPFVGRVSMQMCAVDVSHIPGVKVGDVAYVPARRTLTSARIPRVYVSGDG